MRLPADFALTETPDGAKAVLSGDWTATDAGDAAARLAAAARATPLQAVDLTGVGRMDTAGAYAVLRALD